MANITISQLHPAGFDLLMDSESFFNDLTDEDINMTKGGIILPTTTAVSVTGPIHPIRPIRTIRTIHPISPIPTILTISVN
jgi:hypothetical protein